MNSNEKIAVVSKDPQLLEWVGLWLNRSSGEGANIDRAKPSLNVGLGQTRWTRLIFI